MVDGQVATFEALAVQLLHEVNTMAAVTLTQGIQPTKYKPYLSSLLKVGSSGLFGLLLNGLAS